MSIANLKTPGQLDANAPALGRLALELNAVHADCEASLRTSLDHAIRAGELLHEGRQLCQHGKFQEWVTRSFAGSLRTARAYMRLAEHREEIEVERQSSATLSIASALRVISDKRDDVEETPRHESLEQLERQMEVGIRRSRCESKTEVDLDEVKADWPHDTSFLPADLDASHAFTCMIKREGPGALVEIFPSNLHPGYLYVHSMEFGGSDDDWQSFTARPMLWTGEEFNRESIAFYVPKKLRAEVKATGWRTMPSNWVPLLARIMTDRLEGAA